MANGFDAASERGRRHEAAKLGSRRIFAPQFKLQVLDSYRGDSDCRGNQRATARKYGIHRRQIQKWLQAEEALRGAVCGRPTPPPEPAPPFAPAAAPAQQPVDLSVRRAPPVEEAAWDLSRKAPRPKFGYELEAPPPPPPPAAPQRPFRLFRPYLPEDNFGEPEGETPAPASPSPPPPPPSLPTPPPAPCCECGPRCPDLPFCGFASAFERVAPREGRSPSPASPPSPRGRYSVGFKMRAVGGRDGDRRAPEYRRPAHGWLRREDELRPRAPLGLGPLPGVS